MSLTPQTCPLVLVANARRASVATPLAASAGSGDGDPVIVGKHRRPGHDGHRAPAGPARSANRRTGLRH